jgi:alkylhydroperoxidase/carboxymuconolactone decarboxylase family protein YurZ
MSTDNSERRKQLRDSFIESRGYWNAIWDGILDLDEDFFEAYMNFSSVPWRSVPGIRQHIKLALSFGASAEEIMEVLELTATLGIHACNIGVPILLEELEAAGQPIKREYSERQLELKKDFETKRGYWNDFWNEMLLLDADFFAAYTDFSSVPWLSGTLEPKVKELIYTAFDCSATHMFEPGLRQHVRNALALGASREEIMEVFELASGIGAKAFALGAPALREELGK